MTLESIMNTNVTYFLRNTCQAIERAGGNGGRPRVARPEQIHWRYSKSIWDYTVFYVLLYWLDCAKMAQSDGVYEYIVLYGILTWPRQHDINADEF